MMLSAIHALIAGGWIALVLAEAFFERALLGQGRETELVLARLHWRVDLWIEVPLLAGAVITGVLLLEGREIAGVVAIKLGFAALAVLANLACVYLVYVRKCHAEADDWGGFARVDQRQHQLGALVLIGLLGAAASGLVA